MQLTKSDVSTQNIPSIPLPALDDAIPLRHSSRLESGCPDERPHAVVVGGGLGGIATGIHLCRQGWRVTICEKNERCGGRLSAIEEDGFTIDMGPTLLMMPEVIESIFSACGRDVKDYLDLTRLDPAYNVRFHDGSSLEMRSCFEAMAAEAAKISPEDAANITAMFDAMKAQYENARHNFIEQPFNGLGSLLRPQTLKGLTNALPLTSVYNFVAKYLKDERLRQAFTFQTLYLGISPYDCPSIYALLPYIEIKYGVWFPMGGMVSIVNALIKLFKELGGEVFTSTDVLEITTAGKVATGVTIRTSGSVANQHLMADAVVANVDTPTAYTRLLPSISRSKHSDSRVKAREYGCSAHLLYLGVRNLPKNFRHHEVFLSGDYQGTLDDISNHNRFPLDPAIYTCIPTRTDPSLAPEGCDILYVLTPCPHLGGKIDWQQEGPAIRQKVLNKLESCGFTDLQSNIVFEREFTPPDFESRYGCFMGSAFGLSPLFLQSAYFRPQMKSEEVKHLYFAGAGTHPGGGVPIVLTSGRLAAEAVTADYQQARRRAHAR